MTRWRLDLLDRLEASGRYPTWVLFAVLAGMFATSFPFTILAVSLAPIAEELGASETTLSWVITAPMLLSAVAFPLVRKLGDLRGHRGVFLVGFAGATLVAALTALAFDALSLIALRTLAAVLGSATQPTAMALLFAAHPAERRVRAIGWWSMTGAGARADPGRSARRLARLAGGVPPPGAAERRCAGSQLECPIPPIGRLMLAKRPPLSESHFQTFGGTYEEGSVTEGPFEWLPRSSRMVAALRTGSGPGSPIPEVHAPRVSQPGRAPGGCELAGTGVENNCCPERKYFL